MAHVTIQHAKILKYCSPGMRVWAKNHNLSYISFVKKGFDESVFLKIGDTLGLRIVALARKMEKESIEK